MLERQGNNFLSSKTVKLQNANSMGLLTYMEKSFIAFLLDRSSKLGQSYENKKMENPFYRNAHLYSTEEILEFLKQTDFNKKLIYQTIFSPLEKVKSIEEIKTGYGKGGFVVIKAESES